MIGGSGGEDLFGSGTMKRYLHSFEKALGGLQGSPRIRVLVLLPPQSSWGPGCKDRWGQTLTSDKPWTLLMASWTYTVFCEMQKANSSLASSRVSFEPYKDRAQYWASGCHESLSQTMVLGYGSPSKPIQSLKKHQACFLQHFRNVNRILLVKV